MNDLTCAVELKELPGKRLLGCIHRSTWIIQFLPFGHHAGRRRYGEVMLDVMVSERVRPLRVGMNTQLVR